MPQDKTIKVTDKRTIDPITGKVLTDKYRKHAEIPYDYVQMVIEEARKNKVNPYTALAIGLQETGFKKDSLNNPWMLGNYNPYGNIIEESVRFMSEKEKYAKKLGKATDEDIIQAFNGYGTVKNSGKVYGIDTNTAPIDMNINPVYGKRVVNLRDSVIMQNPEIRNLVEGKTPIKYKDGGPVMQKLKCGGKKDKMKKMQTGGINKVPTMQSSQLATKFAQANNLPQKALSENGLVKSSVGGGTTGPGAGGGAIMAGANLLSDTITGVLETQKKDYTDNRENPESTMLQNANLDVASDVAKSTLSGAAAGTAIMPGIGTIIGGAAGLLTSGVKNILGAKKRRKERAEAKEDWSNNWLNSSVQGLSSQSYKKGGKVEKVMHEFKHGQLHSGSKKGPVVKNRKQAIAIAMSEAGKSKAEGGPVLTTKMPVSMAQGGKITGAGGPKEDKITKKIEDGSFVVPAENSSHAMQLGREYLGWDDNEQSNRNYPGTKVKVSNGEVMFTPEEVSVLSYNGIDLNQLAPNAEEKIEEGAQLKNGTQPDRATWTSNWQAQNEGSIDEANAAYDAQYGSVKNTKTTSDQTSGLEKLDSLVPDLAGAIQIGAAIVGSQKAGAMPDVNVSQYLKELATEQRKDAQYGLEPGTKSAMLSSIERDKRNANNAIVNRGGTAGEVMSNLQSTLSTGIDKSLQIELADASEKSRKKSAWAGTMGAMGGQDFDAKKVALSNWMQWQDVNAGLLNAGIANIVGVRKLRAELEAQKKIGNSNMATILANSYNNK